MKKEWRPSPLYLTCSPAVARMVVLAVFSLSSYNPSPNPVAESRTSWSFLSCYHKIPALIYKEQRLAVFGRFTDKRARFLNSTSQKFRPFSFLQTWAEALSPSALTPRAHSPRVPFSPLHSRAAACSSSSLENTPFLPFSIFLPAPAEPPLSFCLSNPNKIIFVLSVKRN